MTERSIASPDDQGATFVELFFDLVFVFAITQVTHYAAHHLDVRGLLQSVVVFWLIWWGWTQFTWALNAANTDHHEIRVGTLVATGVAFAMAATVDQAFVEGSAALWFAGSYLAVRTLGLGLYFRVASTDAAQRSAVLLFASLSLTGFVAVAVGAWAAPSYRPWIWLLAVAFDLWAGAVAGNRASGWNLHVGHFAERHGLIVIIALGESLIVAGSAVVGHPAELIRSGALAVLLTCLLWWTYFGWIRDVLEERIESTEPRWQAAMARDTYSFLHFPLVCGIIACAVGFEGVFHPGDYSAPQVAGALGMGLGLFLVATAAALWRTEGCVLWHRLVVLALTLAALFFGRSLTPTGLLAIACSGLAVIVAIEQVTTRRQFAHR